MDITSVDHLFKRLCHEAEQRNGLQLDEKMALKGGLLFKARAN